MEHSSGVVVDAVIADLERFALASINKNDRVLDEKGHVDGRKVFAEYVRSFALLDRLEERRLARVIAAGGPDSDKARERFVCSNLGLVRKIASDYEFRARARRVGYLDLVREGVLALGDAVNGFDPDNDHGAKFSSYAIPTIRNRLQKYLRSPERKAEEAKKRAFAHSELAPAAGVPGLDGGSAEYGSRSIVRGAVNADAVEATEELWERERERPVDDESPFVAPDERTYAPKKNKGTSIRTLRTVGVGGLKRRVTVVGSEDDVRALFREARLRGKKRPTAVCEICGKSVRQRDEYAALRWWREHACEEVLIRERQTGRPIPLEVDDPNEARRRKFFIWQAETKERRRVLTTVDRLERIREENRWFEGLAEKGKQAQREAMSRGGAKRGKA